MVAISVVIPLHNQERLVRRAIDSVLKQTRPADDIVVVDDASTDASAAVVESHYSGRGVRVLRARSNSGPATTRNMGLRAATGEWVALLDADDAWDPAFLAQIATLIEEVPTSGIAFTGYKVVELDGSVDSSTPAFEERMTLTDYATAVAGYRFPLTSSSVAVHRKTLLEVGAFPDGWRHGEDLDTWFRLLAARDAIGTSQQLALYYRQPTSLSFTHANAAPKYLDTLRRLAQRLPLSGKALRRASNTMLGRHIRSQLGHGHVSPALLRQFYAWDQPAMYAVLLAATLVQPSVVRGVKHGVRAVLHR